MTMEFFCNLGAILAFISDRMIPDLVHYSTLRTSLQIYNGVREFFSRELGSGDTSPALFVLVLLILPTLCPFLFATLVIALLFLVGADAYFHLSI